MIQSLEMSQEENVADEQGGKSSFTVAIYRIDSEIAISLHL